MSEITDRVKEQLEQLNSSADQILSASRGLYVKIKEESNKQFEELVKTGEAQTSEDKPLIEVIKTDFMAPFSDIKSTLAQLKSASLGLVVKARQSGETLFSELVELGSKQVQ